MVARGIVGAGAGIGGGAVLIQQQNDSEQTRLAADIDAALLADDLPPAAYTDAGFAEFLRQAHD